MKFTICHDTSKKTLTTPWAVLQLPGLVNAERLSLYTGRGRIVLIRQMPMIRERLESIRLFRDLNVGMVCCLALDSRTASDMPCKRAPEVSRTYDAEFLDTLEHYGVEMDGLARLFGEEAAADE